VKYDPAIHHRHSIRLKGYDYSSAGAYFVTAVLQHRMHLFGRVCKNGMQLSEAGKIAYRCWEEIPLHFPHTALDEFIIMPDHMHGIVVILGEDDYGESYEDGSGGVQLNAPRELNAPSADISKSKAPVLNSSRFTNHPLHNQQEKTTTFQLFLPERKLCLSSLEHIRRLLLQFAARTEFMDFNGRGIITNGSFVTSGEWQQFADIF
jgi:hypothetical protein